jgi:carbon-monoxide dehydrogenase small subunit
MNLKKIRFNLNGDDVDADVIGAQTLLSVLREGLGLTAAKLACGAGECGACTVLVDGLPVNSCVYLAAKVEGRTVETVEGLGGRDALNELQAAFVEYGAFQCGYCTPGHIMRATALLRERCAGELDAPSVRAAIAGNICRCTGYDKIVEAIVAVGGSRDRARGAAR